MTKRKKKVVKKPKPKVSDDDRLWDRAAALLKLMLPGTDAFKEERVCLVKFLTKKGVSPREIGAMSDSDVYLALHAMQFEELRNNLKSNR